MSLDPEIYSRFFQFKTAQNTHTAQRTLQEIRDAQKNEAIYKQNEDNLYDWKVIAEKVSKGLTEKNYQVIADIVRANIWFSSTKHNCFRSLEYKSMFEELKIFFQDSAGFAINSFGNTLYNEIYGKIAVPLAPQVKKPTFFGLVWLAIKTLVIIVGFIALLFIIAFIFNK